jgi:predicted MFS family arabinose efflux permease
LTFYTTGAQMGMLVGFLLGGWLSATVGWRMSFVIAGAPGIAVALLIRFCLKEPVRIAVEVRSTPFWEGYRVLAASKTLRLLVPAIVLSTLVAYATMSWAAPFLMRVHRVTSIEAGFWLALGVGAGGIIGSFGSGLLADRLARRDPRWYVWLPALVTAAIVPFMSTALMAPERLTACLLFLFPFALGSMYAGIALSVVHQISPPQFRATATALFFLMTNIFGIGVGTWIIGIASDLLTPRYGATSLRYALLGIVPAAALIATLFYVLAARTLRSDLHAAFASHAEALPS